MTIAEMAASYYARGLWSKERLRSLVAAGKLTAAAYAEITGEAYSA